MRQDFLPFSPPMIGEEEIGEVVDTLRSGWITTGPKTHLFEEEFCRFIGSESATAVSSCTAGLHAALMALGIGTGDEVITTTNSFVATANVIEHVGATPILVDVEGDTLNISPQEIEKAVTNKTKAIIPVHFAGHPAEMDAITDIAEKHHLHIVEDAAHAVPAKYKSRTIGSTGNPTAFSFYATKNLTTGEGGMLTGTREITSRARILCSHGMDKEAWRRYTKSGNWYYEVNTPGYKYNMTDIQASIGLWQLKKLAHYQDIRQKIVNLYNQAFGEIPLLQTPTARTYVDHAWHLYVLRIDFQNLTIDRSDFIKELSDRNIGASVHFIPIHMQPFYRDKYGYGKNDMPVAYDNYQRVVSLPLNPTMSRNDAEDVIEAVIDILKKFKK